MKMNEFGLAVGRSVRSLGLKARRYGPTGLIIGGGIVGVAALVQAVRDTRNGGGEVLDRYDKVKKKARANLEDTDLKAYGEKEYKQDIRNARKDCAIDCVKTYKKTGMKVAVAFALEVAGVVIIKRQLRNTAAALATTAASFAGYRANVREDLGDEKDYEYLHNIKTRKVEKTEVDPETGEEKKVEEEVKVVEETGGDPQIPGYSRWARWFDENSPEWEKSPEYNLSFLKAREAEANMRLKRDGYLFLNDVYDMIGVPRTYEGQIVGWEYKKNNPVGDNMVDFGINSVNKACRNFVNGYEPRIILDFNIDGDILNSFRKCRH